MHHTVAFASIECWIIIYKLFVNTDDITASNPKLWSVYANTTKTYYLKPNTTTKWIYKN